MYRDMFKVFRSVKGEAAKFVRRSPGPAGQIDQGDVIVTTIGTAANATKSTRALWVAAACLAAVGLAGCETSGNLLGSNETPAVSPNLAPPAVAQATPQSSAKIAIAPLIGPPESVSRLLVSQLTDSADRQKIAITRTATELASFTLRGYFVAPTKDKSGNKLSYIWDVTDGAGKRVNRITGEEALAPALGGDPWSPVTPQIIQAIADKTAGSLAAWLPTQSQAGVPVASAAGPAIAPAGGTPAALATSATTTGSISGTILSVAPRVAGAPGDGNSSLASAMRRELEDKGVQFTEAGQNVYRVGADVKIKPPKDGMQAIAINWIINDPKGVEVAKITQNNEVPAGYLDKAWGQSAEDAAKAASVQIKQVIADHRSGKQIQSSAASSADRKVN